MAATPVSSVGCRTGANAGLWFVGISHLQAVGGRRDHSRASALRLYPTAIALPRQAQKSVVLGGYTAPKGTLLMVATWCAHRDARWWERPLEFRPERWDPALSSDRPKFAYFPFGGGARMCIGEEFAWTEGTLVLATLGQRWRARGVPGREVRPEALFTVRPRGGLQMVVEVR